MNGDAPTIVNGSQTWGGKTMYQIIYAYGHLICVMDLRSVMGYTCKDRIQNAVIRQQITLSSLPWIIESNREVWVNHV